MVATAADRQSEASSSSPSPVQLGISSPHHHHMDLDGPEDRNTKDSPSNPASNTGTGLRLHLSPSPFDPDESSSTSSNNASNTNSSIQPVALLMDELKSEETSIRVEAIKQLPTICLALGPERTRLELLPFLQCSLDEEDEVLYALAERIVPLVEYVGGASFAHHLIPILEGLVAAEEPYVRNCAVEAFTTIIDYLSTVEALSRHAFPSIQRLAAGEWFSKKSSAATLISYLIRRLCSPIQSPAEKGTASTEIGTEKAINTLVGELLKLFESLLYEETPLVRKAVATNLSPLTQALNTSSPSTATWMGTFLIPICSQLAADPQDSVRLLAVEPLATLLSQAAKMAAGPLETDPLMSKLIPLFLSLASDTSWRIRLMVATHYGRLSQALYQVSAVDGLGIFCALLRDIEGEVRAAATSQLSIICELINSQATTVEEQIIPTIRLLLSDPSSHVRSALALQLNDVARVLGAFRATTLILPMILQFLRDDSSEVRLNVISKLNVIVQVMGIDQLAVSLLPAIVALAEDRQWRVRQTIIEYIPDLASHLGQEFLTERIVPLLVGWLDDPVYTVRQTTIIAIRRIMAQQGSEWSEKHLLNHILPLANHRNYLRRVTFLMLLGAIGEALDGTTLENIIWPVLRQMATDPIANVRFNVAKTIQKLMPIWLDKCPQITQTMATDKDENWLKAVTLLMQKMQSDADLDVCYYATQASKAIPSI